MLIHFFQVVSCLQIFRPKKSNISQLPEICYMSYHRIKHHTTTKCRLLVIRHWILLAIVTELRQCYRTGCYVLSLGIRCCGLCRYRDEEPEINSRRTLTWAGTVSQNNGVTSLRDNITSPPSDTRQHTHTHTHTQCFLSESGLTENKGLVLHLLKAVNHLLLHLFRDHNS
jgi:hypothetical protein